MAEEFAPVSLKDRLFAFIPDLLAFLASVGVFGLTYLVYTNKIPEIYKWIFEHFYILATIGILGFLGEQIAVLLLIFLLPLILIGSTLAFKFRPEKFAIEDWWEIYSLLVLFSAGFLVFLFYRWEQTKKMKGGEGKDLTTRIDPAAAARYRQEMAKKEAKSNELKGEGIKESDGDPKRKLKKKEEKPVEPVDPNETAEQRMDREVRTMKDDLSKKSMKFSTTLLRMKNLSKSLDKDEIFTNVIEIVSRGMEAGRVQLLLNDDREKKLKVVKAEGMAAKEFKDLFISQDEPSIIGFLSKQMGVNESSGAMGIKECEADPKLKSLVGAGTIKTVIAAPIVVEGKVFGIINVEKMANPDYNRDDQNLLGTCADIAGLVMKNAKLYAATMDDLVSTKRLSEEQLKKNEELKGSLSRIVSPSVAELIMRDPSGLKLGGDKTEVTMFFSDIRGFTKMSEKMDPTEIVEQLNVYFTRMTDILMNLDGTLDKYVGDELMALFGAPVSKPDDPLRAVLCGFQMLNALYELQEVWRKEGKPVIQIGIGINTGIVTAGYMGSEKQLSYTVIGDNVNLAARVMANAKPMQMLITRTTYDRVSDYFEVDTLEPIMVKGKSMPIDIYLVKGLKPGINVEKIIGDGKALGAIGTIGGSSSSSTGRASSADLNLTPEQMKKVNVQIDTKPKTVECGNCGTENEAQIKFCSKCGMPIF